ncbi:MAG TPA: hypothetical protein VK157_16030 [Phycisphaerales bacterium]|nr:hypothetical protein [Phycisphaerales bacterium]
MVDRHIKLNWPSLPLRVVEEGDVVRVRASRRSRVVQQVLMAAAYTAFVAAAVILFAGPGRKQPFELQHVLVGLVVGMPFGLVGWILMRSTFQKFGDFLSFDRSTRQLRVHALPPITLSADTPTFTNQIGKLRHYLKRGSYIWHASATCVTADGQRVRLQFIINWMSRGPDVAAEFFRRCG